MEVPIARTVPIALNLWEKSDGILGMISGTFTIALGQVGKSHKHQHQSR